MLRSALFLALLCASSLWTGRVRADRAHRVGEGQTLSHVARRYHVSIHDLVSHNHLRKGAHLQPGQVLRVPPRGVTYVAPGQTLSHVARAHHCTIAALAKVNHIPASSSLKVGQRLVLPGFAPPRHDKDWGTPDDPGTVTLLGDTGVRRVRLVDSEGRVSRRGLRELRALMQPEGEDDARLAHPRLALLLAKLSDHFGGRPIRVVSGFRDPVGFTSENSRHVAGRAADIQVRGVPRRTVWEYCRRLKGAGCGLYPNSVFTHVDARRSRTQWVDWSRPGRKPRYGTLRGPTRNRDRRLRMVYPEVEGEVPLHVSIVEDTYVALSSDGQPLEALSVSELDDRDADPQVDSDIAEAEKPQWLAVACLAPQHVLVPMAPQRRMQWP